MQRLVKNLIAVSDCRVLRRRSTPLSLALEILEDRCVMAGGFIRNNLISDIPGLAQYTDANLINPWGISAGPGGPLWFADNGSGVSTLDLSDPNSPKSDLDLVVNIPATSNNHNRPGRSTGTVFYWGSGFEVATGGKSAPSLFLFSTEEGTISGWSPQVDLFNAVIAVDRSDTPGRGPIYTGLAISHNLHGQFIYAANFRSGAIDVFDSHFQQVYSKSAFVDPGLPIGFTPFNVQDIGADIYVTYTEKDLGRYDQGLGPGNGFVSVFNSEGVFLRRLISGGPLNAPWGIDLAPDNFGEFSNTLLVGNFADGRINAFDPQSGAFLGTMKDPTGEPVELPGLWALMFAENLPPAPTASLYFAAGIGLERHGLFGTLQPASAGNPTGVGSRVALATIDPGPEKGEIDPDGYPLPPAKAPSLQQSPQLPRSNSVTYFALNDSALALVPTLIGTNDSHAPATTTTDSPGTAGFGASSTVVAMPMSYRFRQYGSAGGQIADRNLLSHGNSAAIDAVMEHSTDLALSTPDAPLDQSVSSPEATETTRLALGSLATLENLAQTTVLGAFAADDNVAVTQREIVDHVLLDVRNVRPMAKQAVAQSPAVVFPVEVVVAPGVAATSQPMLAGPFGSPWQVGLFFVVLVSACCMRFRRVSGVATFERLRSLWSRSTRRTAQTVVSGPGLAKEVAAADASTCELSRSFIEALQLAANGKPTATGAP